MSHIGGNGVSAATWALASTPERLPRRLSTQLLLTTLDELLHAAASPLLTHCTLFRRSLCQLVLHYSRDFRRRMGSESNSRIAGLLLHAVHVGSFDSIVAANLDRALLYKLVCNSLDVMSCAPRLECQIATRRGKRRLQYLQQRARLARKTGVPEHLLAPLYSWCARYSAMYLQFKELIVTRYLKLAYHSANKAAYQTKLHLDRNDLFENMVIAVDRAIDKCSPHRGALTSYVEKWFVSARNHPEFNHNFGTSYTLPPAVRRKLLKRGAVLANLSQPMPAEEGIEQIVEPPLESRFDDEINPQLNALLRSNPRNNLGYLLLGLPVQLTQAELAQFGGLAEAGKTPLATTKGRLL